MFAIEQTYIRYASPATRRIKVLAVRFKTLRGAQKAALRWNWVCRPEGQGMTTESSEARVIEVAQ